MDAARGELEAGLREHRAGQLRQAREIYQRVVSQQPACADAWHLLGTVCWQTAEAGEAEICIRRAIDLDPDAAVFHENLARVLESAGRLTEAAGEFRAAARLMPGQADLHFHAAELLMQAGDLPAACAACEDGLMFQPENSGVWNNLGSMCRMLGDGEGSVACYREAVRYAPQSAVIRNNLGIALQDTGRLDEALDEYREALQCDPSYGKARYNLARTLNEAHRLPEAIAAYEQVVAEEPDFAAAWENLGAIHARLGQIQSARGCYDRALAIQPGDGMQFRRLLTMPLIFSSTEEIERERHQLDSTLDRLSAMPLCINEPLREIGLSPFGLAWQGCDDRAVLEKLSGLLRKVSPALNFTAPHCIENSTPAAATAGSRVKIGFLSPNARRQTLAAPLEQLILQLPRNRFEVYRFEAGSHTPTEATDSLPAADQVISLPNDLAACQQQIASCGLDVLYYPEPGMDPLTWMLSFSRLAPVQCAGIGHPVTGGISTVDYFLSDRDLEPENSGSQYTEQLVRLEGCPAWFTRPEIAPGATRAQFGLPDGPLYLCPQEPFRFHPEFDALLAAILAEDPTGTLVLFEGEQRNWTRLLVQRLSASIPQFLQRVKILPRMPASHRLQVLQLADVALDTLHSSDLLTAIRLVAAATPVVTWPGHFLRSRATAAVLERLGVTDTIASSAEEYVRLATGLATSPQWRNRISRDISEATPQLFEAPVSTASLERFLLAAVERSVEPPVPLPDILQLPAEHTTAADSTGLTVAEEQATAPVIPAPHFRLSAERAGHHVAAESAADAEF